MSFLTILLSFGKHSFIYELFFNLPGFSHFRVPARILLIFNFCIAILAGFGFYNISQIIKKHFSVYHGFRLLVVFILFYDLFSVSKTINKSIDRDTFTSTPKTASFLKEDKTYFRIGVYGGEFLLDFTKREADRNLKDQMEFKELIKPNTNLLYKISSAHGYTALPQERYFRLISLNHQRIINLLNVKYVITGFLDDPDFEKVFEYSENLRIYRNKEALDRAWIVYQFRVIKEFNDIMNALIDEKFDPEKEVILEEYPKNFKKNFSGNLGDNVRIIKYKPNEVKISANLKEDGLLVLSDTYYPGWKVFVNNREEKIYTANLLLRSVHLRSGKNIVHFIYKPMSFTIGYIISLSIIILIFFYFLKRYVR